MGVMAHRHRTSRGDRYAAGLERALRAAHRPAEWSAAVPVQRGQIHDARDLLSQLAATLRRREALPPAALADVRRLLTDCSSPLFAPAPPGALRAAVAGVLDELDHGGPEPQ
jgi:hypothetical protein